MKSKILQSGAFAVALFAVSPAASAQTFATYAAGSSNNAYALSLGNYYSFNLGYSHTYLGMNMRPGGNGWTLGTDGANNGGAMLVSNIAGALTFMTIPTANPANVQSFTDAQVMSYARMQINSTGQVRIGVQAPSSLHSDYRLSVDGKLVAKSIYVTNPNNWADFVFAPTYKPMSLLEVESYLKANKHLPYIPSASEVVSNGYSVTEMDANLLRTVEELTLQVIEMKKEIEKLKSVQLAAAKPTK